MVNWPYAPAFAPLVAFSLFFVIMKNANKQRLFAGFSLVSMQTNKALGMRLTDHPLDEKLSWSSRYWVRGGGGTRYILAWVGRCGQAPHTLTLFKTKIADLPTLFKSVSMRKPGRTRQGVIMLKSPISLKLGTNVRYQELTYVTEFQVKILNSLGDPGIPCKNLHFARFMHN